MVVLASLALTPERALCQAPADPTVEQQADLVSTMDVADLIRRLRHKERRHRRRPAIGRRRARSRR
jgi:hypothetical protein